MNDRHTHTHTHRLISPLYSSEMSTSDYLDFSLFLQRVPCFTWLFSPNLNFLTHTHTDKSQPYNYKPFNLEANLWLVPHIHYCCTMPDINHCLPPHPLQIKFMVKIIHILVTTTAMIIQFPSNYTLGIHCHWSKRSKILKAMNYSMFLSIMKKTDKIKIIHVHTIFIRNRITRERYAILRIAEHLKVNI